MRQTGRFSLKQFSLKRKKLKTKQIKDKSKPQQRTGPTPAPGCKQQQTCGKAKADKEAADKTDFGLSFGKHEMGKD